MSTTAALSVTHTSTVTPDQIDELGHMNVRWYGHNAHAGTMALAKRLGIDSPSLVSTYTRHHHEQLEGNKLEVRSAVLGGGPRLRVYHELRNVADEDLAATFVHELASPSVETPGIELPDYGRPRSISLDGDLLQNAPSLDELRSRGLAIRLERPVDDEDTMGADVVPPWLANNLIWGGERPDGDDDWIRTTANGDRMAHATMESRLSIGALPALGTRIQSYGALINVGEKITHGLNWVYDLDTEQALAAFEVIDLAFNMTTRRSMVIPDDIREDELARLHPDLATN